MSAARSTSVLEAIRDRRSIRRYLATPVPRYLIETIVEAACWSPTAGNRQDWQFDVVEGSETKSRMAQAVTMAWSAIVQRNAAFGMIDEVAAYASGFDQLEQAPVLIVVSAARPRKVHDALLGATAAATIGSAASAAMAAQNLMLAAHALGLGTCCLTGALAASDELTAILGLPSRREVVCLVTVGYPDESPASPARRPISEVIRYCT